MCTTLQRPEATLGKWKGADDPSSYTNQAIKAGNRYFDLGDEWGHITERYGLSDNDMFNLLNRPFLDEIIREGKPIRFTHDPENSAGYLRQELEYVEGHGYMYDRNSMTARKH